MVGGGGGLRELEGIPGGVVTSGSPNTYPISDQKSHRFNCADIGCLWLGQTLTKLYTGIAVFRTDSCKIIYPA